MATAKKEISDVCPVRLEFEWLGKWMLTESTCKSGETCIVLLKIQWPNQLVANSRRDKFLDPIILLMTALRRPWPQLNNPSCHKRENHGDSWKKDTNPCTNGCRLISETHCATQTTYSHPGCNSRTKFKRAQNNCDRFSKWVNSTSKHPTKQPTYEHASNKYFDHDGRVWCARLNC